MLVVPVRLHWLRLFRRRYNQAALLYSAFAPLGGLDHCPDLRRRASLIGRRVLIVDDVMTSFATLAAAAEACIGHGAASVSVLAPARVAKEP